MSTRESSDFYEPKAVDVDSRDPNIRGIQGSILHTATEEERNGYVRSLQLGLTKEDALDRLATTISLRLSRTVTRATDVRV